MMNSDTLEIKILGSAGAGNRLIAEIAIHELATAIYDQVYIIWSGINRLDTSIGIQLHKTFDHDYAFTHKLNDTVWYSSGGIDASGSESPCPIEIRKWFNTQYVGATNRYLTDLTLSSVISVQALLTSKNIPYHMAFIYNLDNQIYNLNSLENVLGAIDRTSPLNGLVSWTKIQTVDTPYEWCQQRNLTSQDKFHPTIFGMKQWLLKNFNLNIDQLVDLSN